MGKVIPLEPTGSGSDADPPTEDPRDPAQAPSVHEVLMDAVKRRRSKVRVMEEELIRRIDERLRRARESGSEE